MRSLLLTMTLAGAALLAGPACDNRSAPAPGPTATAEAPRLPAFRLVADRSEVCMVNDEMMNRPQIPVEVDGKTYFGCCPACKDRLRMDVAVRTATDPVTGAPVDKATAVIAMENASGRVLYFASEETWREFAARQ
jgi:YHS domain-containing protein